MIGRIDDYLREVSHDNGAAIPEEHISKARISILKRAIKIFIERKYKAKICVAALRGVYHVTGVSSAPLILSIHPKYQSILSQETLPLEERIGSPVESSVIDSLRKLPEFLKAYEPDGMLPGEFITYGATQRTLSQLSEMGWKQLENFQ